MRLLAALCAVMALGGGSLPGQQVAAPAKAMSYDVATIKPNNSGSRSSGFSADGSHLVTKNVTLKDLLAFAYDIKQDLILGVSGPLESARFDVAAKSLEPDEKRWGKMTNAERGAMLLPILQSRYGLKMHVETREQPLYELVLAKGGPKFKAVAVNEHTGHIGSGNSRILGTGISTGALARTLADTLHRTVLDKTGLDGNFDIDLQWTPEGQEQGDGPPGIFTAVEDQLGLKLRATKGPAQVLVVDHAEMPSEN